MNPERWRQIEDLYHSALERGIEGRAEFLDAACGSDQELRREVESLLAHDETLLNHPVGEPRELQTGVRLGPYQIVAKVGAGGMGEVYKAEDTRLGREVAIKVLPQNLSSDPQAARRFEREARAVAALSHPNILAVYDVGSDQGIAYLVTELLEGETLRSRLKRGAIEWREAAEIGREIAEGLAAAHFKGIIHRDLKPENIFLTRHGQVKILDFGLARWSPVKSSSNDTSTLTETQPGVVMGTVGYMSPEQVRGEAAEAPSDMFSLGCVLYEVVAGRRAFARQTPVQTMTAILEQEPPPLVESGKRIPQELDRLIGRCLMKNPAERIQSARDLSLALKELATGATTLGSQERSRVLRWAVLWMVTALAVLLCAAGFYFFYRPSKPVPSLAVLPFVNASGNRDMEYLSDGITDSLINSLSQLPNLAVMSRNSVFRYKGQADAQAVGRALNVQSVLTGRVVQLGDSLSISTELVDVRDNRHIWGEQYDRKVADILDVQVEISTEISDRLRLKLSGEDKKRLVKRYTQNSEAYQLYLRGRYYWYKKTPDGFDKGIEYFQKATQVDPNYAPAYAGLAELYNNLSNYNFALLAPNEAGTKAQAAAEKALQIDDTLGAAHSSLAITEYQWGWDWANAEKEFRRAIELDPTASTTFHWYSHLLMTLGRVDDSIRVGRRAVKVEPTDLGNNAHQGWYYLWTREYARAVEPLKQAIEMDPSFPVGQWYLGLAYEQQGEFQKAIAQFQNCVRITAGRPSMLALLGHAYAAANRKSEAKVVLKQLSEIEKEKYVPSYPVATIYTALGDKEQAMARLERAYNERDSWMDYLGLDPRLDSLRSDTRFATLLRRMNLKAFVPGK